jgi:hypothetical protein
MLEAVTPLPRPLTTPPVTSTYFIVARVAGREGLQARKSYLNSSDQAGAGESASRASAAGAAC